MKYAIRRLRMVWLLVLAAFAVLAALALSGPGAPPATASDLVLAPADRLRAFETALEPIALEFPRDHGAHLEFQTEWWYFTGNLSAESGEQFGYQLTFFRRGLAPGDARRTSRLATNHLYFAHFALTDVAAGEHRAFERFSRGAAGLAGAAGERLSVHLEDWAIDSTGDAIHLRAAEQDIEAELTLTAEKPPVAHGDGGLSPKGEQPGNASYYVSLTDLAAQGSLLVGGRRYQVSGSSWFDHEWGTGALGPEAVGWDWFGLQLSDGRDLMLFQIRRRDGSLEPLSGGTIVEADGSSRSLAPEQVSMHVLETWESRGSGAEYPVRWQIRIPSEGLELQVEPLLEDQENRLEIVYWEGAVGVSGTQSGIGYLELTGYAVGLPGLY